MKIICRLLLAMACLCLANISWATVCANSTGVAEDEHYDLSNIFNSTNNQPGQIVVLPEKSGWVGVSAICPPGTLVNALSVLGAVIAKRVRPVVLQYLFDSKSNVRLETEELAK